MIFKTALKNFFRQGLRAVLNVLVTALIIIAVIFNLSLLNGFQAQGTQNMVRTNIAGGHYLVPGFDILTPTEWEDLTQKVPEKLRKLQHSEKAEVLVQQGQIYPNRRLFPIQLRGIEMSQTLLDLPLQSLQSFPEKIEEVIPVVLGSKMAKKSHLKKGDTVVLKWRDKFGAVDARDILIVEVVTLVNPRIDEGVVWLRLDHLREITQRKNEVTWVAVRDFLGDVDSMEFQTVEMLMKDLLALLEHDRRNARILWVILMFLAGISIFNNQILILFRRQREIGTLMAFGMTSTLIVALFTFEGSLAAISAVFVAALLGIPFFAWFQSVGLDVSHLSESSIPVKDKIYLDIQPMETLTTVIVVIAVMILVAWIPSRKISRMDPTLALRGRGIT
jgi:ABC-type lipoprotein release transport system permease subunit